MAIDKYYNRFNSAQKYVKTRFLASRGLQSAELNEIQEYSSHALKEFGDALFADGDIVSGCTCVVDNLNGNTTVESGKVYLKGLVRDVDAGAFTIPIDVSVRIGVYYKEKIITELEDPNLRDPAVGTRNFQEVGATRLQYSLTWGYEAPGVTEIDSDKGEFYTIYNVENGVLVQKALAPQMESVNTALARYDNESNGSYVVRGMNVTCLKAGDGYQMFSIGEGKAHINGYEVELAHALRSRFDDDYDTQIVTSDPYLFDPDGLGKMTIKLNYQPVLEVISVDISAQKTTNLTHGSYSGALDPIPNTSIEDIVEIKQGGTTFIKGTDYKLTSGQVDWSLSGNEPAPGSSYQITYRYRTQVEPTDVTDTGFTISGAVEGSTVLVTYTWKMPRYDLITIDAEGIVRRVKGLAHPWSPSIPKAPTGQLVLAQIYQTWKTDAVPSVSNKAIRVVKMSDIESMKNTISDLYYLVAQLQLKNDANSSDPTAKKGIFVDPFLDDDMRDQGVEQTGAIVNGRLMLAIDSNVTDHAKDEEVYLLPYELEPVISQEMQTGSMKVNPYSAFDPIPADVKVTLNIDHWTEIQTEWLSPTTEIISRYNWWGWEHSAVDGSSDRIVSSTKTQLEFMRQLTQKFSVDGLKPNETVTKIVFDGVDVIPEEDEED